MFNSLHSVKGEFCQNVRWMRQPKNKKSISEPYGLLVVRIALEHLGVHDVQSSNSLCNSAPLSIARFTSANAPSVGVEDKPAATIGKF
ncbi:hypothetical protein SAMN03084138_04339 [Enterovibrio norvegicus DSM 15893]|uniref:Uncharacterized protein n=1 Tax=Enterovibrio norvegicus DSM 15893 TaxID=1121869 RepID=A0A1I5WJ19_9GAMM|nr:hypothetical protein SAMN03084138_04339 [Enterovibrio norvegicus DSM 15893]